MVLAFTARSPPHSSSEGEEEEDEDEEPEAHHRALPGSLSTQPPVIQRPGRGWSFEEEEHLRRLVAREGAVAWEHKAEQLGGQVRPRVQQIRSDAP